MTRRLLRFPRAATLRGRLALLALVTTTLWVVILTAGFNIALAARLRQQADDLLRTRAAAVAATVEARPDGVLVVHEPSDDRALDVGVWIYQGHKLVEGTSAGEPHTVADRLVGRGRAFAQTGEPYASRLYALPVIYHGRQIGTVVASVGLDAYRSTADTALAGSIGLGLLLLGGIYLVTRTLVGRALRPVAAMSAQASRWSERGAAERFGPAARPAELASLAASLDELLDRLAAVLRHEQQQSAELSHELRTPLARITAETDWLTARPRTPAQQRASHEAIAASAAGMQRICESLLSEARTRNGHTPGRCDLREVARDLARRAAEHRRDGPTLTVGGDSATAGVSATVAERILTPLLDNARRYATRTVTVETTQLPGLVRVTVRDDGPGVPEDFRVALFEPGRRADPMDGHDGAGLGLALARRLARAAGGDIELASAEAGAAFTVTLPAG
ncbi:HAMP domain-containing histidine kinase [Streptomyces sp. NBC_01537]|uniref:ATP-binding protein n=1 Tax=Streptomyces sp. NBC_01537 TaxID=2903896 RepID=UPI0038682B74